MRKFDDDALRLRALGALLLGLTLAWLTPLLGVVLAGQPVLEHLRFPPRTEHVPHAAFDWGVFALLALPVLAAAALYVLSIVRTAVPARPRPVPRPLPWWAWLGVASIAAGWFAAWHDDLVPEQWRRQTFTPLWLGYILVVNGLTYRRTGGSPLTHRTGWLLALFPASAAFWWLFEHLNRFVDNWYYTGVVAERSLDYVLQGTLPFSTVLPAVLSTWAWLRQYPRLEALALPAVAGGRLLPWLPWVALLAGLAGLAGVAIWPEALYAMLWLGPLLVLCALQRLLLGETLLAPLARGDWRPLLQPALAALVCGLFWEMWNYGSLAQWHYSIPYAQRFHIFEMPLLGYAGYLPFGVTCAVIADLVARLVENRDLYRERAHPASGRG